MVKVSIVNVVATAALNQKLDINELSKFREVLYDPDIYNGRVAYFQSGNMKGKVSIFVSGKMISTGTVSEKEAVQELEYVKDFLVRKGYVKPTTLQCKIQNIVLMVNFEKTVDLERLVEDSKVIYEPEQFPGGILKLEDPCRVTALIFTSGKAVVTGLKSSTQIAPIIEKLGNIIQKYAQTNIEIEP
jgi:TATA-box binding protein (TBP) (component of TFIID and TFIIIB)